MCKWTVVAVVFGGFLVLWLSSHSGLVAIKHTLDSDGRFHYLKAKAGQK